MQNERKAVTRLTLDLQLGDVQKSFGLTKGDVNRRLEFTLIDGGRPFEIPSNWVVWLVGTKPDETELKLGCVVEHGRVIYDLASGNQLSACEGYFPIWLTIFNEAGEEVYSPGVGVDVRPGPKTMNSEDQNTAIAELIAKINGTQEEVGEIQSRLPELAREVQLSTLTIQKSQWEDGDPKLAYGNVSGLFAFTEDTASRKVSILLLPVDNATRVESRSIGIAVDNVSYMPGVGGVTINFSREGEAPATDLKYVVIAFTEPNETGKEFAVAAGFIGIGASSTDQLEEEVETLKQTAKENSERITDIETSVEEIEKAIPYLEREVRLSHVTVPASEWTDGTPTTAVVTIPTMNDNEDEETTSYTALLVPANAETRLVSRTIDIRVSLLELNGNHEATLTLERDGEAPTENLTYVVIAFTEENKTGAEFTASVSFVGLGGGYTGEMNEDLELLQDEVAVLKGQVADILYVPIAVNSFASSVSTVEKGVTVNATTLTWSLNKAPKKLTVGGIELPLEKSGSYALGSETEEAEKLGITSKYTWTISATDERDKTVTKDASVNFYNGVYYGVSEAPASYDSAFIIALGKSGKKTLRSSKLTSFSVTAEDGQYIYYCLPVSMGTCSFKVGGFDGGFDLVATLDYTNEPGHEESYRIYRSTNAGLGATNVEVK